LSKQRVNKVLPLALTIAAERLVRIPTGELNRLLRAAMAEFPAPSRQGRPLKFYYATQAQVAPPTFVIFVNDRELVHFSYVRFLENRIRATYPFQGTPLRLEIRKRSREDHPD
jgi:GTP-binding protein